MSPTHIQAAKAHVWDHWAAFDTAAGAQVRRLLDTAYSDTPLLHASHPINTLTGSDAIWAHYWEPLRAAFPDLTRRVDMFLGGDFAGQTWVVGAGYFEGRFVRDWLGIPATGSQALVRFCECCRVHSQRIAESYLLLDLLDLIHQAGYALLPPSRGSIGRVPPPRTGDGLVLKPQPTAETQVSFERVHAMLFQGLNAFDQHGLASMGMAAYWHVERMAWYGPYGIGTCNGLHEFEAYHQRPFLAAFPDRAVTPQDALIADGHYVAASGFPGVVATHTGPYLGCAPSNRPVEMWVMDIWRREGDRLVENWVMIDLPHLLLQAGRDLFAEMHQQTATQQRRSHA
jgi:predicted ester cyclase